RIEGSTIVGGAKELTWNEATQSLDVNADITAGSFRFVANGDPLISLGDAVGNGVLTYGGNHVTLGGGSYLIKFYADRPDYTYEIRLTSFDRRGLFYTTGQSLEIGDLTVFTQGYAIQKFKNITSTGAPGSDTEYPDTDFPMFRLADILLMASEAIVRGNGDRGLALDYFNRVRTRAYLSAGGNISDADLNLQIIIDERARELYWEGHRRTDLIRFGQFSQTDYIWAWKGGVPEGKSVELYRNVFPIPSSDLSANPNLVQNPGY
ncbi:MAG: RagB/SusD family nutrient uptake outer membrane protein, partial [Bacteroidota bacterium]|nr:RagB/SusD family nutrient uptake outer membrane protein [Bacteroidota bacterium]